MKIQISEMGNLLIERAGRMVPVGCPISQHILLDNEKDTLPMWCGDWCALFGEPEETDSGPPDFHNRGMEIRLCHKSIHASALTDNRKGK